MIDKAKLQIQPGSKISEPKTRNVFVDTSAFINENFAVKSTAFKSLVSLCRMHKAFLKLTDVTICELKSNIEAGLAEASKVLQNKGREMRILRNVDNAAFAVLFKKLDEAALQGELFRMLQTDFKNAQAEVVGASGLNAAAIFEKYFKKQPPFGPSKKKAEFPDAFVLRALEEWCANNNEGVYVVSTDRDMQSACSDNGPLFHLNSIAEFVDLVLREEDDQANFLAQLFTDNPRKIIDAIRSEFEDTTVYLEDQDGSGEPSVTQVTLISAAVVSMSEGEITLEMDATIAFNVNVSYADPNATSYDNEDHTTTVWNYIDADLDREENVPVEVTIAYDEHDYLEYRVINCEVNGGESVSVYVDEDAKTYWK